jgi:hypothetical protein
MSPYACEAVYGWGLVFSREEIPLENNNFS